MKLLVHGAAHSNLSKCVNIDVLFLFDEHFFSVFNITFLLSFQFQFFFLGGGVFLRFRLKLLSAFPMIEVVP